MRVIAVKPPRKPKRSHGRLIAVSLLLILLLTTAGGVVNYMRPLPLVEASATRETTVAATTTPLAWPTYGQSSVGLSDGTVLATNGKQTSLPIASIAKVITALCVLERFPLAPGQTGPSMTITQADLAIYSHYVANDGSVVPVELGETLTEYQILEALMLPSANNIADSAAIWAYGSLDKYFAHANNKFLLANGMTQTKVGVDASGLDSATQSTAADLVKLGSLATKQPVLMEIARKKSTVLPVAGTVYNYNFAVGQEGITGLKTGNNDYNLGALLYSADVPVAGKTVQVVGAVMGASSLRQAVQDTASLVASAKNAFSVVPLTATGAVVATYTAPWGASTTAVTTKDLHVTRWNAQAVTTHTTLSAVDPNKPSADVGTVYARAPKTVDQTTVVLKQQLAAPSFWWRLTRH